MTYPDDHSQAVLDRTTVHPFPLQQVLGRKQAATYLGIPVRRLWLLEMLGGGPRPVRQSTATFQFRKEDLDRYSAELFSRAGFAADVLARYRRQRQRQGDEPLGLDPFMDMATRDELREVCTYLGSRAIILLGLVVIVLSHTPLSRMLFHVLR
ncbi:hypothetical protein K2X14_07020 [Acetobacter sp. TBRC 12305]|uniref:Helix-turn-helix domain-containing protein n=1 Tax=Acetobacter garciniae TaxID=2817435 RepID=A0A939KMT0_9PROT|nr:hypothetical protein [Acetobacter garciniae]MBO1324895.1 hypothetical protein [Acetobacter garciniae]MBX0344586.1 hypothetical protein [Acetobacter garciniae]